MSTNREKILAKIAALRAKTLANGCSEAEAMAAAEKAAELMDAYELDEADVAAAEDRGPAFDIGRDSHVHSVHRNSPPVFYVARAIGTLCRCRIIRNQRKVDTGGYSLSNEWTFHVVGDRPDREMAAFLVETVSRAIDAEYRAYAKRNAGRLGRSAKASFEAGMIGRLNARIWELVRERQAKPTGTALVLVDTKSALVEARTAELFPKLRSASTRKAVNHGGAYRAGQAAAERVGLGRPLGGGGAVARLG